MIYKMANNRTLLCTNLDSSECGGYISSYDFHTTLFGKQGKWWKLISYRRKLKQRLIYVPKANMYSCRN